MPTVGKKEKTNYYAADRWPQHDFMSKPPKPAHYQIVRKKQIDRIKEIENQTI